MERGVALGRAASATAKETLAGRRERGGGWESAGRRVRGSPAPTAGERASGAAAGGACSSRGCGTRREPGSNSRRPGVTCLEKAGRSQALGHGTTSLRAFSLWQPPAQLNLIPACASLPLSGSSSPGLSGKSRRLLSAPLSPCCVVCYAPWPSAAVFTRMGFWDRCAPLEAAPLGAGGWEYSPSPKELPANAHHNHLALSLATRLGESPTPKAWACVFKPCPSVCRASSCPQSSTSRRGMKEKGDFALHPLLALHP